MKKCKKCLIEKEVNYFFKNSRRKDGRSTTCKACDAIRKKRCQRKHKYSRYGITNDQYLEMLNNQSGACKICNQIETLADKRGTRSLAVDHCHVTGKVRGLLCARCNQGIGSFRDNSDLLKIAASYIDSSKK